MRYLENDDIVGEVLPNRNVHLPCIRLFTTTGTVDLASPIGFDRRLLRASFREGFENQLERTRGKELGDIEFPSKPPAQPSRGPDVLLEIVTSLFDVVLFLPHQTGDRSIRSCSIESKTRGFKEKL
jgi:hypothetical protein